MKISYILHLLKKRSNFFLYSIFPIEKITLSFCYKTEPSFKEFSLAVAALKLISQQQPYIIRAKKSRIQLKIRKGIPLGVKVTLRNANISKFLIRLMWEILPGIKGLNISHRNLKEGRDSFSFELKDIFLFSELKKFYFFFNTLPSLKVTLTLRPYFRKTKNTNNIVVKALQIPF